MKVKKFVDTAFERENQYRPGESRDANENLKPGWGEFPVCPVSKRTPIPNLPGKPSPCPAAKLRDFKIAEFNPNETCDLHAEELEDG